jgi:hypothetical protein
MNPVVHTVHSEAPAAANVPAAHWVGAVTPKDGHAYPPVHGSDTDAAAVGQKVPAVQAMHVSALMAVDAGWYVPAGQGIGATAPAGQ